MRRGRDKYPLRFAAQHILAIIKRGGFFRVPDPTDDAVGVLLFQDRSKKNEHRSETLGENGEREHKDA